MGSAPAVVLYVLALVAAVVCVDVLFFRQQPLPRLIANITIVLVSRRSISGSSKNR